MRLKNSKTLQSFCFPNTASRREPELQLLPYTCLSLRDPARLWQPSDPPLGPNSLCLTPSSPLLPLFPPVTPTLQPCPAGSSCPHHCANPTAAPLPHFRVKFSLNQGSSSCLWRWGEVCHRALSNSLKTERPRGSPSLIFARLAGYFAFV